MIWIANGDGLAAKSLSAVIDAGLVNEIFVSPVSAWEIGMLSKAKPGRNPALQFLPDPKAWFARFMAGPGIREVALTPDIAIDASDLPGDLHADPGDRLIVATARHLGVPIVTRDSKIIDYAKSGFVEVVPC